MGVWSQRPEPVHRSYRGIQKEAETPKEVYEGLASEGRWGARHVCARQEEQLRGFSLTCALEPPSVV